MTIEPKTTAERRLIAGVAGGGPVDVGTGDQREPIRADLIRDICLNPDDYQVPPRGLRIERAIIKETLDLHSATVKRPLVFWDCQFDQPIDLEDARVRTTGLLNCETVAISADNLRVDGNLFFDRTTVNGEVRLLGAHIEGSLYCIDAKLSNKDGHALGADRMKTGGGVFLNDLTAEGDVWLLGAKIGGGLSCDGAKLSNRGEPALSADGMETGGDVFLQNGFLAEGEVRLLGAKIGGVLGCRGATLENEGGNVFTAEGMVVKGGIFWDRQKNRRWAG